MTDRTESSYVRALGRWQRPVHKYTPQPDTGLVFGIEMTEYFNIDKLWEHFEAFLRDRGDASLRDVLYTAFEEYTGSSDA